jgi:phage-related protein
MALYTCYYYTKSNGKAPVKEFIDSLDTATQTKFFFKKALLEEHGTRLPAPHCHRLKEGVFELRFQGSSGHIRVLYFFTFRNIIIFTNGFKKKTNKVPKDELLLAIKRRADFLSREK